ncbi:MAG: bile acid:sodium symporter family protein [Bacteroidales bacterium]|nr:bile acid:sodium symporter family protein [Bacteroidales bacterium]
MKKACDFITRYMSAIVLAAAAGAFLAPDVFGHVKTSWITPMLGCVMFGMGLTLDVRDIAKVFSRPRDIIVGCLCQFTIMPLLAYLLAAAFRLPPELAVGVILVGCCPGGTSSNVITYLSKGDVPLSVGMTAVSTLLAPVATPLLVKGLAGAVIPVDFWGMFLSITEVVIAPIILGLLARRCFVAATEKAVPYLPAFSATVITLIVTAVVAANSGQLSSCGLLVAAVVVLHNICGYALGFAVGKVLRLTSSKATAVSVEVGMQNSGLACSLAHTHFPALAMASVPGAIFSVWHNISGALLSKIFSNINTRK